MIDLHIHTNHSGSSYSVGDVLRIAKMKRISIISITDHNTVGAYKELLNDGIRKLYSGEIIPGCEITTTYNGEIIEVLGYDFDIRVLDEYLKDNLLPFYEKQQKEYYLIKDKYQKLGIKFNIDHIVFNPDMESPRKAFFEEIKNYPENGKHFLYKESLTSKKDFTRKEMYNPKSPLYIDETNLFPSLEKTIEIIHQAGGVAFLAHPFMYSESIYLKLDDIIKEYDFDGIECFYPTFTLKQQNYLLKYTKDNNLYRSGGSDSHGKNKINHKLGSINIAENIIKPWHKSE